MKQKIYKKQFSIGEILSKSWKLYTKTLQAITTIILIIYIPINIILVISPIEERLEGILLARIANAVINFLINFIGIIATMAIAYVVKNQIDGKTINAQQALRKSVSRWWAAIKTNLLTIIFLIGLLLLLIVPGVIYAVYWNFALYAVILNNKSGKEALDYSKNIVKGRWWTVLGYLFVFGITNFVVSLFVGIIISIPVGIFLDVLMSFFTVVSIVFYINFESTRKILNSKQEMIN